MATIAPLGAYLEVTETDDGQYKLQQVTSPPVLPKVVNDNDRREINVNIAHGALKVTGYVIPSSYEIGIALSLLGVGVGSYYGSLTRGTGINVDIFGYKGRIEVLKEGNQVVLKVALDGSWAFPNINETVTLLSL